MVCNRGQKATGDYCDANEECIDGFCSNHSCDQIRSDSFQNGIINWIIGIVGVLIIIVAIIFYRQSQYEKSLNHSRKNKDGSPGPPGKRKQTHDESTNSRI